MTGRIVNPVNQRHYIDPYQNRVFQYDSPYSDIVISRAANSILRVFGDDIVMKGMDIEATAYTDNEVTATIEPGAIIQDITLLENNDTVQLLLDNVSGLDSSGKIVIFSNYQYLQTFEKNDLTFNINYISATGVPLYPVNAARDRILLGIFEFVKDENDNVINFYISAEEQIVISGKTYYIKGRSPENRKLGSYIEHNLISEDGVSSIIYDNGLKLVGDEGSPGPNEYYGTDSAGMKGYHKRTAASLTDEGTKTVNADKVFEQHLVDGNLYMVTDGYDGPLPPDVLG